MELTIDMTETLADPVDRASLEEQRNLELTIKAALSAKPKALPYTGLCYNCSESMAPGNRFCDTDCRDDYEKRESSRSRRGIQL